jgi:hypothetical protein
VRFVVTNVPDEEDEEDEEDAANVHGFRGTSRE